MLAALCFIDPERVTRTLLHSLEDTATEKQRTPHHLRVKRLGVIAREIEQLTCTEEALIARAIANGKTVERRAGAPAQAILQVRIAREEMAARRQERISKSGHEGPSEDDPCDGGWDS